MTIPHNTVRLARGFRYDARMERYLADPSLLERSGLSFGTAQARIAVGHYRIAKEAAIEAGMDVSAPVSESTRRVTPSES